MLEVSALGRLKLRSLVVETAWLGNADVPMERAAMMALRRVPIDIFVCCVLFFLFLVPFFPFGEDGFCVCMVVGE